VQASVWSLILVGENYRSFTFEIIVVNDGSKDRTSDVVMEYVDRAGCDKVRLLQLEQNRGKGGAISLAVARSRGHYILMADSDGATDIRDLRKLYDRLKGVEKDSERGKLGVGVGSRAHMQDEAVATVSAHT
jgi:dolichyl-phosphate beta-glucosyltransferase